MTDVDTASLEDVQLAAMRAAEAEVERVVRDPEDAERIEHYHRAAGVDWTLEGGEYDPTEDFWCGTFAGFAYRRVGQFLRESSCVNLAIREKITRWMFASTSRLRGRWKTWRDVVGVPAPIILDPSEVRPGDLLLVYTGRTDREWGDHVCVVSGRPKKIDGEWTVPTVEGNASNIRLGDGTIGEGVGRGSQTSADIAVALRPRPEYFEGALDVEYRGAKA